MLDIIIEHVGEIIITGIVVIFLLNYIANDISYNDAQGIQDVLAEVPTTEKWDENLHTQPEGFDDVLDFNFPEITLTGDVYKTSEDIFYKDTFILKFEDGSTYPGSDESGMFRIVLKDILLNGGSVYKETTWDDIYENESINIPVGYFTDTDTIYFFSAGNYTIVAEVKFDNGASVLYNIPIPVEINRN